MESDRVTIAIMGATGSGKSTFINLVSGSNFRASSQLASCTQNVEVSPTFRLDNRRVNLIDTPGFDDTDRSEVEILQVIADHLAENYQKGMTLHGVLYFHRISDIRMGGAPKRSFRRFRMLCGDDSLKNVTIVTNMWNMVPLQEALAREKELATDQRFFKPALDEGARMARHYNTIESAHAILRGIFANHPLPLSIQKELVDDGLPMYETAAGKDIKNELEELVQRFTNEIRQLRVELDEIKKRDAKIMAELQEDLKKSNEALKRVQDDLRLLSPDYYRNANFKWAIKDRSSIVVDKEKSKRPGWWLKRLVR